MGLINLKAMARLNLGIERSGTLPPLWKFRLLSLGQNELGQNE